MLEEMDHRRGNAREALRLHREASQSLPIFALVLAMGAAVTAFADFRILGDRD